MAASANPSKKRKVQFVEEREMSDTAALKHSRSKFDRSIDSTRDDRDEADTSTREEARAAKDEGEFQSKHTLDSDEEEEEKYERLDMDKVEGQEEATEDFEGNTKITPFNMREELEEGHFDTMGNFIYKKGEENIKDAWLDNIDWAKIKKDAGDQWQQDQDNDEDAPNEFSEQERKGIYESLLKVLEPNETAAKALRRMGTRGGEKMSAAEERKRRWAAKKAGGVVQEAVSDAAQIDSLTGLIDKLVSNGEFEAYQYTFEKIKVLLAALNEQTAKRIVAVDKDLDMFGDPSDAGEKTTSMEQTAIPSTSADVKAESSNPLSMSVEWEYKWSADDGAEVVGPISTDQMVEYQESGFFKAGAWARKFGATEAPFYSTKRIDFDIYT